MHNAKALKDLIILPLNPVCVFIESRSMAYHMDYPFNSFPEFRHNSTED